MKFSIKDRLVIPPILPSQGSYINMVLRTDILKKITLSQDEIAEFGVKVEEGKIVWDISKEREVDIELTDLELNLIRESLKTLDKEEKLTEDIIETYKKIIN